MASEQIVFVDGEYWPADQAKVSAFDGGFLYGDGIYTTLRLYQGLPLDLAAHYERLCRQTKSLDLSWTMSIAELKQTIAELTRRNNLADQDGRLRITISRAGDPLCPLPLTQLSACRATVVMTLTAVSADLARWQAEGIPVICLDESYARGNFPGLKTLNALATLSALRRAAAAGCPEAILTGPQGHLLEGAVSNIFLVLGGQLLTPASDGEFLAGRTRERILKIAAREKISAAQKMIKKSQLSSAAEVFVVSSVREVLPVVQIDGQLVGEGIPGPVTRLIQSKYRDLIARDLRAQ